MNLHAAGLRFVHIAVVLYAEMTTRCAKYIALAPHQHDFLVEVGAKPGPLKSGDVDVSSMERMFAALRPYLSRHTQFVVVVPNAAAKQRQHFRELAWQDLLPKMGL